ncbi:tetratricopeptide repeat protein [Sinimarinibacterium thermocellulolyticum]|uniref:Tetratricopeptide repeat protein n=1 Tax=Sinimarinibacterium thermocellulolyticum TaxID=3170016 RepID=A0ABV2ACI3_9GAMM
MPHRAELVLLIALGSVLAGCSTQPLRSGPILPSMTAPAPSMPSAEDAAAAFKAALELMKTQRFDEAEAAFRALAEAHPSLSGALTNLCILRAQARDRDAALHSFSRAVDANPDNAVALNWLGVLYRESGDYLRAEQAYRRALAAQPQYASAQLNLGILYDVYLQRPHDAVLAYRGYRDAGGADLIVEAWIRELEARHGTRTAHSGAAP